MKLGLHSSLENVGSVGKKIQRYRHSGNVHPWRGRCVHAICYPCMILLGSSRTLASGIGLIRAFAVSPGGEEVYNADITRWFVVFGALTLAANVYAVVAVSYRAWYVRGRFDYERCLIVWTGRACELSAS